MTPALLKQPRVWHRQIGGLRCIQILPPLQLKTQLKIFRTATVIAAVATRPHLRKRAMHLVVGLLVSRFVLSNATARECANTLAPCPSSHKVLGLHLSPFRHEIKVGCSRLLIASGQTRYRNCPGMPIVTKDPFTRPPYLVTVQITEECLCIA